jgi:predicted ArsR family transcriptional regulator
MSRKLVNILFVIILSMKPASATKSKRAVLALVRGGPIAIPEIAGKTGLSPNAVRFHLDSLEAEGLVEPAGRRAPSGPGKPASMYMVTAEADLAFSRAYAPVLAACVAELRERLSAKELTAFLQRVGKRLGADAAARGRPLPARVRAASEFLNAVGGLTSVTRTASGYKIVGRGCPLAAVVEREPCACRAVEGLVTEIVGRRAVEKCDRSARPSCCFEVSAA